MITALVFAGVTAVLVGVGVSRGVIRLKVGKCHRCQGRGYIDAPRLVGDMFITTREPCRVCWADGRIDPEDIRDGGPVVMDMKDRPVSEEGGGGER